MEILQPFNFNLGVTNDDNINLQNNYPKLSEHRAINDVIFANDYSSATTTLFVDKDHGKKASLKPSSTRLFVWGCGEFGQHGHGHNNDVTLETSIEEVKNNDRLLLDGHIPVVVASGSSHTLVLTDKNSLFSWGNGTSGQLGNGSCETSHKPVPVAFKASTPIAGMACGARHSFFWTETGECHSFGNNFNAQLGHNFSKADFKDNQMEPVLVEFFPGLMVKSVACGARHTLFLMTTGNVMAVGCNQQGQIGNGSTDDVVIPIRLEEMKAITHIACGNSHSLAANEIGQLYAWGYGKAFGKKLRHVVSPKVFNENFNSPVRSLAGGDSHSMALYQNGILYTWGNNYEGQLGLGQSLKYQCDPEPVPSELLPRPVIQISSCETMCAAVTAEGKLYMWGKNAGLIHSEKSSQYFQFEPHHIKTEGKTVKQVSCGAWHVAATIENTNEMSIAIEDNVLQSEVEVVPMDYESDHEDSVVNSFKFYGEYPGEENQCIQGDTIVEHDKETAAVFLNAKDDAYYLNIQPDIGDSATTTCVANMTAITDNNDTYVMDTTRTTQDKSNSCAKPIIPSKSDLKVKCKRQNSKTNSKYKAPSTLTETSSTKTSSTAKFTSDRVANEKSFPQTNCANIQPRNRTQGESHLSNMKNVKNNFETFDITKNYGNNNMNTSESVVDSPIVYQNETKQQIQIVQQHPRLPVMSETFDNIPRPQTVPVINLDFQSSPPNKLYVCRHDKAVRKPSFRTFRGIWKSSKLLREKQSQKVLNSQKKSQSDMDFDFNVEHNVHTLPSSTNNARGIRNKWAQCRERKSIGNIQQSTGHVCSEHSGELLPSICSCKNRIILPKEVKSNNIFIERYKLDMSSP